MNDISIVSIIVVNYNGKKYLEDCFKSLEKLNYPKDKYKVIMVDNASSDDSVEFTRKIFPWIKILKLDKNYGFCKPNNEGAKIAHGEYLIFLNNDTIVTENWLINLVSGVNSHKNTLSAGCKMVKPPTDNGTEIIIDYAGGKISPDGGGIYVGMMDKDQPKYNVETYTGFGCGAGVIVNREFFLNTGGFDEYFFAGYEEMDLGLRIWRCGYKVVYLPKSVMYHKRLGTFGSHINHEMLARNTKNRFYFILKNFEGQTIILFLFLASLKCIFEILYFFLKGNLNVSIANVRGVLWFLKDIKDEKVIKRIFKEKKKMKLNKKVSDVELYKYGIISTITEKIEYCKRYLHI